MLDVLEQERVTSVFLVPTQWQAVVEDPTVGERDLSRLGTTCWGAAPATTTLLGQHADQQPGGARGGPRHAGRPAGRGGEIVYRGPTLMQGHWDHPAATEAAFSGGWFHSGDLVRMDEEGFFCVVDRAKDMIISGGDNVSCTEVVNALAAHPEVAEVSVVGRPDPHWGETPVAVVVPRAPGTALTVEDLRAWADGRLARYELPTELRLVEQLPRSASGKVLKNVLREACRTG